MFGATVVIWLVSLAVILNVIAFVIRFIDKCRTPDEGVQRIRTEDYP
jgi:uncharacterized membrane protein YsdA (DUF1294 family)